MAGRIYDTAAWERLRATKLAADPFCEYCPPGVVTEATEVDHLQAIEAGGDPWAWHNLRSCCHSCHSIKTMHVDRLGRAHAPVKGCDATGMPLDPRHPWNEEKSLGADENDRAGHHLRS